MTSIVEAEAPAVAPTHAHSRNAAIDRSRTLLTVVVLIHHAVIPYTYFGHTDPKYWIGFDVIVLANDSYFMAMFFFLSGLFVWPALAHRARGEFARDRMLRLGLPFAIGALTVIPVAYFALQPRRSQLGFGRFWWDMVTIGPWPSGPIWFTWVLLVFGIIAGVVYRTAPHCIDPINRLSQRGFDRPFDVFVVFTAVTMIAYVPARVWFGPSQWIGIGPFEVQESRLLLYAVYFIFGIGVGAADINRGVFSADGALPRQWLSWSLATLVPYAMLWLLIAYKREILHNPAMQPAHYEIAYGMVFAVFSALMLFALLALFLRFQKDGWSPLDPLQHDAYGIFLVHYMYVLWLAYWLFDVELPAIAKASVAFVLTLLLSWATSAALRQIPGAKRVL